MAIYFTEQDKTAIAELVKNRYTVTGVGSQERLAKTLGLKAPDITNLFKNNWQQNPQLIGAEKWITFARYAGFQKNPALHWNTAETEVYLHISRQLELCQNQSMAAMLVDEAGIGKTHTAKRYAQNMPNSFYVDCSVSSRKTEFIRALAKAVGVGTNGKLADLLDNAIYALSQMEKPLIILDEAGDLEQSALLIVKRIYNALEDCCGVYMIGADGLRTKINSGLYHKRLGFAELYSRFGKRFTTCLPTVPQERIEMLREMAAAIAVANGLHESKDIAAVTKAVGMTDGGMADMRRVKREIQKIKSQNTEV